MSSATDRVAQVLRQADATVTIRTLDSTARTAALAAEQLHVPVGAIANSLVFDADGSPLLVMTSGAHRVDTAFLAGVLGVAKIRRADPDFVRTHTGQAIGGVAPVGHPRPIRTIVDTALEDYPEIWAAAGHPRTVFATTYARLLALTAGVPGPVTPDDPGT